MTMVPSLLVSSKVLLEFLLDKDTGLPLAAGIINLYKDSNRLIRKNWYYKTGTYSAGYTYAALPNPMTLNASGAIVDSVGNEVTPYYYPFDEDNSETQELYYVSVFNSAGTAQFTRQGFPPLHVAGAVGAQATYQNLIVNNQFWNQNSSSQASGEVTLTLTNETNIAICPSNHDGYSMPDIRFLKDVTGANDTIVFKRYLNTDPIFTGNVTPQFYINISCTSVAGEGYKFIQFPITLNTRNLEQEPFIFTVQTQLPSGAPSRTISAKLLKYLGSANTVALGSTIGTGTITPAASWTKATLTDTFPTLNAADVISPTEDDAFYVQLSIPVNQAYEFNIAVPSLYLGDTAATNDFQSYDKIDSITNSPRTGDFRHTLNRFQLGWVPANDGTIGQQGSVATTRANTDTWPLYKLIWENTSRTWTPLSAATAGTAYADFIAGTKISLTKNLGRVLQGLDPIFVTPSTFTATLAPVNFTVTATPGVNLTLASPITFTAGTPIRVSSTGTLPAGYVSPYTSVQASDPVFETGVTYYISSAGLTTTNIRLTVTRAQAIAGTDSITFTTAGAGTQTIVNTNNVLTLATSQSPVLKAGTSVIFTNSGGGLPSGLSASTVYYITSTTLAATTITVSDNLTDALAGYFIPILNAGTGTQTVSNALGSYNGSSYTTQVARHNHLFPAAGDSTPVVVSAGGATTGAGAGAGEAPAGITTFIDGVEKVSLMQPASLVNLFIKL